MSLPYRLYLIPERDAKILGIQAANYLAANATTGRVFAYIEEPRHSSVLGNFYTRDAIKEVSNIKLSHVGVIYQLEITNKDHRTPELHYGQNGQVIYQDSLALDPSSIDGKAPPPPPTQTPKRRLLMITPDALELAGIPANASRLERRQVGKKIKVFAISKREVEDEVEVTANMGDWDHIDLVLCKS